MQTLPLLWLSAVFVSGILIGDLVGWRVAAWLSVFIGAILIHLTNSLLRSRLPGLRFIQWFTETPASQPQIPFPATVLLAVLALGAARLAGTQPTITPQHIAWYNDRESSYVIEGTLSAPPDQRDTYTNLRIAVEQVHPAHDLLFTPVHGQLLVRAPVGGAWQYGDLVRIQGYLKTPPEAETFSYREYLERQAVFSMLSCSYQSPDECVIVLQHRQGNPVLGVIYALREHALQMVHHLMPDPEGSLLAGILLGIESGIAEDLQQAFRDTGTAHIIAISGFNFTIISSLFIVTFSRLFGRWRGALVALLSIALYALLVGAGAGVIRAAIMSGVSLGARQFGRRQHAVTSLSFTAALMAFIEPQVLWDVSFQLSFTATLGLILYAEPLSQAAIRFLTDRLHLTNRSYAKKLSGPLGEYFMFTLAAQVTTLPVTIYHFQRLSILSLIANPLILPAQPPIMGLGGLAVLLGSISLPLGQGVAWLCWLPLAYTTRMVEWLANFHLGNLVLGRSSLISVLLFYALLLGWTFGGQRLKTWLASWRSSPASPPDYRLWKRLTWPFLAALFAFTIITWQAVLNRPDDRLHLTVLDVGSGDAILIQTPGGRNLLVDGGPSVNQLSDALGRRLPLINRKLDVLIIAATSREQVSALPETLPRFPPASILWSGAPMGSDSARRLQQYLAQARLPITLAQTGQALDLGQEARLHILSASSHGAVLLVEWGNFRALLPVGLDFTAMDRFTADVSQAPVTVLLLAQSGYAPLNPPEWIARWQPQLVLLSVAAGDYEGRPQAETLAAVEGYHLLRTDQNGWIEVSTDGKNMWVEVEQR